MTEWTTAAKIAFSMFIAAAIMGIMSYFMFAGKRLNMELSRQDGAKEMMREYREFNGYSDKVVYAQDVVSMVAEKRGRIGVRLQSGGLTYAYWCDDDIREVLEISPDSWVFDTSKRREDYTATGINEVVNINKMYRGKLTYSLNGEVLGITFTQGMLNDDGSFTPD